MAFKDITLGQYIPGNSPLHRLDPRAKILLTLVLIVTLFLITDWPGYAVFAGLIAAAAAVSRIRTRYLVKGLRPLTFILLFTFGLHLFMDPGRTLFALGPVRATWEGLVQGVLISIRLALLVVATSLLTLTTSPIALTDGIESLLGPGKAVGVPAHELAMMMTIALRFIPTLLEEADKIMKAQTARGADFETGGIVQRAKALVPILVPLFVSAFRRADELAVAMEARCYRGGKGRTRLRSLRFTVADGVALLAGTALMAAAAAWF